MSLIIFSFIYLSIIILVYSFYEHIGPNETSKLYTIGLFINSCEHKINVHPCPTPQRTVKWDPT